jgi:hypothetical protein
MSSKTSRREFIRDTSAAAVGGALALGALGDAAAGSAARSRVVLVRNRDALVDGKPRRPVIQEMLDLAVRNLSGKQDTGEAWAAFIRPTDVVGIKSNVWRYLATTPEVEGALAARVRSTGVAAEKVAVGDRGVLADPVFRRATALINARPLRTHHWSGVGSLIKNYIMFVDNPAAYHGDSCADLASIWKLPIVRGKTRLNVLVLLTPQFHSVGPHSFHPKYVWQYHGLLVGTDPVAVDATGLRILEAKRLEHFGEARPLVPPAKHVALADTRHHLGNADPARIQVVKIGHDDASLI